MITQQKEKIASGIGSMADSAKDAANKASDAVKDGANRAADTGANFAGKATDAVKDAASNVAHRAADAGAYIAHKAEDATSAVGGEIKSLGGAIRDKGPHDGMLGNASAAVAGSLESCGRELQEHGLSGIADDVTSTIRRHPVPSVLIGMGLGFMLARVFSK